MVNAIDSQELLERLSMLQPGEDPKVDSSIPEAGEDEPMNVSESTPAKLG